MTRKLPFINSSQSLCKK